MQLIQVISNLKNHLEQPYWDRTSIEVDLRPVSKNSTSCILKIRKRSHLKKIRLVDKMCRTIYKSKKKKEML